MGQSTPSPSMFSLLPLLPSPLLLLDSLLSFPTSRLSTVRSSLSTHSGSALLARGTTDADFYLQARDRTQTTFPLDQARDWTQTIPPSQSIKTETTYHWDRNQTDYLIRRLGLEGKKARGSTESNIQHRLITYNDGLLLFEQGNGNGQKNKHHLCMISASLEYEVRVLILVRAATHHPLSDWKHLTYHLWIAHNTHSSDLQGIHSSDLKVISYSEH